MHRKLVRSPKLQDITHPRIPITSRRRRRRAHPNITTHLPRGNLLLNKTPQASKCLQHRPRIVLPNIVPPRRDMQIRPRLIKPRIIIRVLEVVIVPLAGDAAERVIGLFDLGGEDGFEAGDGEGGVVAVAEGVGGLLGQARFFRGGAAGGGFFEDDFLGFAGDCCGVPLATGDAVDDFASAFFALAALFILFPSRGFAPEPSLLFLGGERGFGGCGFLR